MNLQRFVFNMFGVNTFIIWDEQTFDAAIVDPGMINDSEIKAIDSFIAEKNLSIKHLICTHLHIDHVFGAHHIIEKFGVNLEANSDDSFLGENLLAQARLFGLNYDFSSLSISHELHEGDKIFLGNESLEVLHVPGHSPGGIALYSPSDNWVIVGDALFKSSIGRTDLAGGNYAQLIDAISTKLLTLPNSTIVYPGHGPSTTIAEEKSTNPYL